MAITKLQARQAKEALEFANSELKQLTLPEVERAAKGPSPNFIERDGALLFIENYDTNSYEMIIDVHKMQVHDIVKVNNKEVISLGWINGFLGDLTDAEQFNVLSDLCLISIRNYLSDRCGYLITLEKRIYQDDDGQWNLDLYSDNLIKHSGVCKAMLKDIHIECNRIRFIIDQNTGEQRLCIGAFNFYYTHINDGRNGHEMGRVRVNENGDFEGYNYNTERYEVI